MFDRILQLFTKRKLSNDAREFITKLADTNIWILGVGLRGVPAITGLTDQAALEVIAANRSLRTALVARRHIDLKRVCSSCCRP